MVTSVNSINSANTYELNNKDNISKLLKYVNNESLQEKPDTFTSSVKSAAGSAFLFEGIPFLKLLKRNKKLSGKFVTQKMKNLQQSNHISKLIKGEKSLLDYIIDANKSKDEFAAIKSAAKKEFQEKGFSKFYNIKSGVKSNVSKFIGKIFKKSGTKTAEAVTNTALTTTEKAVENGAKAIENGVKAAGAGVKEASKFSKILKSSGARFWLIFGGIQECMQEVIPTFKELGKEKGMKQIGKSSVKVLGDTVGFVGGQYIGTAIGAAIGSVVPVVGTAIGGILGFIGGFAGSFLMGKVTRAITGKTEREKAKELQEQNLTEQYAKDNKALNELKEAAAQKIQTELESGKLSDDGKLALQALDQVNIFNQFSV